jgi:hypothetical protein
LLKEATKNLFFWRNFKTKIVKYWNRCIEVEGDYVER